jgi:hypothetical protein
MSFPRKSFARQIITMMGYTDEQEIGEVMYADKVDRTEAVRRLAEAKEQRRNRSAAQFVRHCKEKDRINDARRKVLSIAYHDGQFLCAKDLSRIALFAGWPLTDTGRPFREICMPLFKEGLTQEFRDEDDRFVGYTLTDAGRKELIGDENDA